MEQGPCRLLRYGNSSQCLAEGARFEASIVSETIGSNSTSSFQSQSLTEESEAGGEPIESDRTG